jgi:hypothetical protein
MDEKSNHAGTEGFAPERLACLNLVHAYNNCIDDGVLDVGRAVTGIDAIRSVMKARALNTERRTTHVTSNVQFTEVEPRTAATTSVLLLFVLNAEEPLAPAAIIRCNDRFLRLDNGEWRFTRRSLTVIAGKI